MEYRILKSTQIENNIYLYPIPVQKEKKYLILIPTIINEIILNFFISQNWLDHPDLKNEETWITIGMHTDRQTSIIQLSNQLIFPLLSHRQIDLAKATIIEKLLSNAIHDLLHSPISNQKDSLQTVLRKMVRQTNCSECERLGIIELETKWKNLSAILNF